MFPCYWQRFFVDFLIKKFLILLKPKKHRIKELVKMSQKKKSQNI